MLRSVAVSFIVYNQVEIGQKTLDKDDFKLFYL